MEFLQPDNTLDIIHPALITDYDLFFGPIIPNTKPLVQEFTNMGDVLVTLGLAQSRGWCRKNNWLKDLRGYQEFVFGSKRIKICVLMPNQELMIEQGLS